MSRERAIASRSAAGIGFCSETKLAGPASASGARRASGMERRRSLGWVGRPVQARPIAPHAVRQRASSRSRQAAMRTGSANR